MCASKTKPGRTCAHFETALRCGPVATVDYPGIAEPMLVVRFPCQSGTKPVAQPDEIWSHRRTNYAEREDCSAYGSMPLGTTGQSPRDLSAEFEVTPFGTMSLTDVHVL
jgi:hypothetical protein